MKIIGGFRGEIDISTNPKFPENSVTFETRHIDGHENYPEVRAVVICWTICRGAGLKVLAFYQSPDLAKQVAKDLQQAYDSGEKVFILPKEIPPARMDYYRMGQSYSYSRFAWRTISSS